MKSWKDLAFNFDVATMVRGDKEKSYYLRRRHTRSFVRIKSTTSLDDLSTYRVLVRQPIKVGYMNQFAPLSYVDEDGSLTGLYIATWKILGERLGLDMTMHRSRYVNELPVMVMRAFCPHFLILIDFSADSFS